MTTTSTDGTTSRACLAKAAVPSYANPAAYEYFMGRWSARLAPLFIQFVGVRDGQRILDVGCGTGSLSRALLASGNAISVVGVDPTEDYIAFAQQEAADSRARFRIGAAESLPFLDKSFDATMGLLVLQGMDEPARAVREMARTTRPGGSVAACEWDFRDGMPMYSLFWQAAEAVAPEAAARRRAEPPRRLGAQTMTELWIGAGLASVRTTRLELSQAFGLFDDFWRPFLAGATPTCAFAAALDRETGGELANALRRIIPNVRPDGSFALSARAHAVAGIAG
jgi:SAM-dependent methyltransferase